MSAKFTEIRDRVYDKLGDSDYFVDPAGPSVATLRQVGHTINDVIREVVLLIERLGYYPLAKKGSGSLSVVAGTDTYDIYDTWADYRSRLTLIRTDTKSPVPMYWPEAGDYQAKEWLAIGGYLFGMDLDWISTRARAHDLVLLGPNIVFVLTPTKAMTLNSYYLPVIPQFANVHLAAPADETLVDLGLNFLEDHIALIVKMVVNDIRPDLDEGVPQAALVSQLRSSEILVRSAKEARGGPRTWRWKSPWLRQPG